MSIIVMIVTGASCSAAPVPKTVLFLFLGVGCGCSIMFVLLAANFSRWHQQRLLGTGNQVCNITLCHQLVHEQTAAMNAFNITVSFAVLCACSMLRIC
jgi:hypothetical protein